MGELGGGGVNPSREIGSGTGVYCVEVLNSNAECDN